MATTMIQDLLANIISRLVNNSQEPIKDDKSEPSSSEEVALNLLLLYRKNLTKLALYKAGLF